MPKYKIIKINKTKIKVEIADTYLKKAIGLMLRKKIKGTRMLFEFQAPTKCGIWMIFMKFPIDIIFIDANNKVSTIAKNARPMTLNPKTWRIYLPNKKCKYVLETESGFAYKNRIKIGQKLTI